MRWAPFFRRGDKPSNLHIKRSNVDGDLQYSVDAESNASLSLDLHRSNVAGDITINYNGGSDALEQKINEVLTALTGHLESKPTEGMAFLQQDIEETQQAVHLDPEVPSAIESMNRLSRILRKSGYYDESRQLELDIANLMIETDDVRTQIRGMVRLARLENKKEDWFDQLRPALKLAIELDCRHSITLVTDALFYCRDFGKKIESSDRLLNDILIEMSRMTPKEFINAYPSQSTLLKGSGLDLYHMLNYLQTGDYWRNGYNRFYSKRLFSLFKKVYKDRHSRQRIRGQRFRLHHPKLDILLDMPGLIMGLAVLMLSFGRIEADWLLYDRWKAWAVLLLIIAGIWYW